MGLNLSVRKLNYVEQVFTHLHSFRRSWNKDDTLSVKVFLTSTSNKASNCIRYNLLVLHVCVGPGGFSKCKFQTSRWWSVDSSASLLTPTSNTERNKSVETMQLSMSDRWPKESLHRFVQIYLLEDTAQDAQRIVTTQLRQESAVIINVSITMSSNHFLAWPVSFSWCALKFFKKDRWFISLRPSQRITNFLHEFLVQSTWVWTVCLYRTQGTAQQLQHAQSSQWDPLINTVCQLRVYKLCWCRRVSTHPLALLHSVRTTTLNRKDVSKIRVILFGFHNQFVLFPCDWSNVPLSNC